MTLSLPKRIRDADLNLRKVICKSNYTTGEELITIMYGNSNREVPPFFIILLETFFGVFNIIVSPIMLHCCLVFCFVFLVLLFVLGENTVMTSGPQKVFIQH